MKTLQTQWNSLLPTPHNHQQQPNNVDCSDTNSITSSNTTNTSVTTVTSNQTPPPPTLLTTRTRIHNAMTTTQSNTPLGFTIARPYSMQKRISSSSPVSFWLSVFANSNKPIVSVRNPQKQSGLKFWS